MEIGFSWEASSGKIGSSLKVSDPARRLCYRVNRVVNGESVEEEFSGLKA
jgi:hypothetical protein